jgi:hypothetical protein
LHYEQRHVPLGLSFIEHFRWRKYVRNYVVGPAPASVDFDCVTEFWVAGREDQQRTAQFVASPAFSVLDEDDRRFLDVTRRLSFEVEETVLAESKQGGEQAGAERLAMFIARPATSSTADFAAEVTQQARAFAATHRELCDRIALDLRGAGSSEGAGPQAILSAWPSAAARPPDLAWPDFEAETRVARLEAVESAADDLFGAREDDPEIARRVSIEPRPQPITHQERESR